MTPGPQRNFSADETQQEIDRVVPRVKHLPGQLKALDLALEPYRNDSGEFDSTLWEQAFLSNEPPEILRVAGATRVFESLVNHMMEMLQSGAKLAGLDVGPRPEGPTLIDAVVVDGGLTEAQGKTVLRLYRTRNDLQHSSPDVEAGRVHADISVTPQTVRQFANSYGQWMQAHNVKLFGDKK